ncbi:cytochrome c biogenesis protein CcsA [Pelagicoccus sp. SDUM812003]|uniref:cytochrome c biogenesis protein n=1 Tax=Pelagicoccus sp. SDUM812003 TaxID=3041267 RepID=UPI00280E12CA|nr:cytochrome c biogenesis protein CcsA [Pelagicoccus sp. SDUM812003]MDQ8204559.1 cytochrome c biogenesis protein CcsA [Pelagicoccus sp. SDUM812003]
MKRRLVTIFSITLLLYTVYSNYQRQTPDTEFDLDLFGRTPVVLNGRIQPLDSVARNSLLAMNGKRTATYQDKTRHQAIEWLSELMFSPLDAAQRPVFRIYDDTLRSILPAKKVAEGEQRSAIQAMLFGKGSSQFYYSFMELRPFYEKISKDAVAASEIDSKLRTRYQSAAIDLANNMVKFNRLSASIHHGEMPSFVEEQEALSSLVPLGMEAFENRERGEAFNEQALAQMMSFGATYQRFESDAYFFTHPQESAGGDLKWEKAAHVLAEISRNGEPSEISRQYARIVDAYRQDDPDTFNQAVQELHTAIAAVSPEAFGKSKAEQQFNYLSPFYVSMVGYVMTFLLVIVSWIRWQEPLNHAAFWTTAVALLIHSSGILYRIYIIGYAPVINLYSSAIFVGWGAVFLALLLEKLNKNGIGNFVAAMVGFSSLIVAHHLGDDGDTLEMMRAVLDSNFWLSTHVIIITLGYASTFLSGFLAIVFILLGLFTTKIDKSAEKSLKSMVYGIVCFSTLFSFVGTILGGIWADQSWGRFWGWDPKENGAILLVLWNALILHARWGGFIKTRGLMAMAVFGNVVTSWSWMGTNMLGIGLHSYGFMSEAFVALIAFVGSQMLLILMAMIPPRMWKSNISA